MVELKNYRTLIRASSARLAICHLGLGEYSEAADYCIESNFTIEEAYNAFKEASAEDDGADTQDSASGSKDADDTPAPAAVGEGDGDNDSDDGMMPADPAMSSELWQVEFCRYLENILFNPRHRSRVASVDPKVHDHLLTILAQHRPDLLGEVMLDSALQRYTVEHGLKLLNRTWKPLFRGQLSKDVNPTPEFAAHALMRVLLFLELGQVSEALDVASLIDPVTLYEMCADRKHLVIPSDDSAEHPVLWSQVTSQSLADIVAPVLSPSGEDGDKKQEDPRPMLAHMLLMYAPRLLRYMLQAWEVNDYRIVMHLMTPLKGALDVETPFSPLLEHVSEERLQCLEDLVERLIESQLPVSGELMLAMASAYLHILSLPVARESRGGAGGGSRRTTVEEGATEGDTDEVRHLPQLYPSLEEEEEETSFLHAVEEFEALYLAPSTDRGIRGAPQLPEAHDLARPRNTLDPFPWLAQLPSLLRWSPTDNNLFGRDLAPSRVEQHTTALSKLQGLLSHVARAQRQNTKSAKGSSQPVSSLVHNSGEDPKLLAQHSECLMQMVDSLDLPMDMGITLQVLASAIGEKDDRALTLLLDQGHLQPALTYAVEFVQDVEVWKTYITRMTNIIQGKDDNTPEVDLLQARQTFKDIFLHLSHAQTPDTFLSLLPEQGATEFFVPFITRCFQHHKSSFVHQSIVHDAQRCEL
eukprot:TRINITY_DN5206_c0_g1_i1.p1 TRINITY_DN5206_c0_g1~~TRINITY_DN5206_c0_g1_i1.p1  ORF type:complete len:713 (+),score=146.64 TRINITY_DN5206_c0_g1_i1:49-2139(+)